MLQVSPLCLTGLLGLSSLALSACASNGQKSPASSTQPTSATTSAAFDRLKTLNGEWVMTDPQGNQAVGSIFAVTSANSALREVMFPGSPHEMTNMYHLDGDAIVATHYCAAGNQPRMRCASPSNGRYEFVFEDITNLIDPSAEHMAELTLTIVDDRHVRQEWWSLKGGNITERTSPVVIELTRK